MAENVERFIGLLRESLKNNTFVKLSLGNYKGRDEQLQKITVREIETKKGRRLSFQYSYKTQDIVKNHETDRALETIRANLGGDFFSGHIFTTENDVQIDFSKKGKTRLKISKPVTFARPSLEHDRKKIQQIDPARPYLRALGITTHDGRVRDKQQDKWRQINKFVEILSSMFDKSSLRDNKHISMVDMGSGKGYLTFAAYDYFTNSRRLDVTMTGVEARGALVELCNRIAEENNFEGLRFVEGPIAAFDPGEVDVLIALHACDTATDDALFKGIAAKAELIVAAPCCHKEIRPQIEPPAIFEGILKHGVMLERTAETVTDGLRSLLLERSGYSTRLFEFVPVEHTPKNNMLVAIRGNRREKAQLAAQQISSLKAFYGIKEQRLERLLA